MALTTIRVDGCMVCDRLMSWALAVLGVLVVVMASAYFVQARNPGTRKEDDGHSRQGPKGSTGNASKWAKAGRTGFLASASLALVDMVIILCLLIVDSFRINANWFIRSLDVVSVLLGGFESIMLFFLSDRARDDRLLWIYAWFLLVTIMLSVAGSCTYLDGEAGLDSVDSLMPGVLILLTAVVASINLLLYIHDLWDGACGEDLRWFRRTLIFEVITVAFVVAVILAPRLKEYSEFPMALELFFTIATWEYLKHIWDERIMPARR